ncbi:MAG: hypothetical protein QXO25_05520 [Candidatus Bathyarchaeia archaeon]
MLIRVEPPLHVHMGQWQVESMVLRDDSGGLKSLSGKIQDSNRRVDDVVEWP